MSTPSSRPDEPGRITFDLSSFPLVIQGIAAGHSDRDLEHMCEVYDGLLRNGQRFANVVYFAPDAALLSPAQRRRVAEWWSSRKEQVEALNLLSVTVTPSGWVRGALTAIHWFTQPRNPQKVAATVPEAIDMCTEVLAATGLALSPDAIVRARLRYDGLLGSV